MYMVVFLFYNNIIREYIYVFKIIFELFYYLEILKLFDLKKI